MPRQGMQQRLAGALDHHRGMGIDNMLAAGAASHGNLFLLLFGLLLSIPMVVFMSNWLSTLMDR